MPGCPDRSCSKASRSRMVRELQIKSLAGRPAKEQAVTFAPSRESRYPDETTSSARGGVKGGKRSSYLGGTPPQKTTPWIGKIE
jgi:hypothetical protein